MISALLCGRGLVTDTLSTEFLCGGIVKIGGIGRNWGGMRAGICQAHMCARC